MWSMSRALFISVIVLGCLIKSAICQTQCSSNSHCNYCASECPGCLINCYDSICQHWNHGRWYIPCSCYARPGHYCNGNAFTICPPGYICPSYGMTSPTPCPAGSYCSFTGSDSPTPCPIGFICPVQGLSAPRQCPGGYICPTTGLSAAPQLCPVGFICPIGSSAPTPCPPNSTHICITPGRATLCGNGTYTTGEFNIIDKCIICPAGSMCIPDGTPPVLCPSGTYSLYRATECTLCSSGTYTNSSGNTECKICPTGSICTLNGCKHPVICPAGTYSPYGATQCTPCANGTYSSSAGSPVCTMCPLGYTTSSIGATSLAQCACRPGYSKQ